MTGWNEEHLFRIFLDSLNDDVRDELLKESRPSSFNEYLNRALIIDRQLIERRVDRASRRPQLIPQRQQAPAPMDHSRPMDLTVAHTQQRHGPLTQEERARRYQNNLCLICGSSGHLRAACPIRRVDFQPRQ
jgi:hypothetical protein